MTPLEIAGIIGAGVTALNALITWHMTHKKDNADIAAQFRNDLLERLQQQQEEIEQLHVSNREIKQELSIAQKEYERQIANWKDSYYVAQKQLTQVQEELRQVRREYEKVHTEYTNLLRKIDQ
jgi:chromosome segregation ATPase